MTVLRLLLLLAGLGLLPRALAAQTSDSASGILRGIVLDDDARPISGATVSLPTLRRATVSNDSGHFFFRDLPPTELLLLARRVGYRSVTRRIALNGRVEPLTLRLTCSPATMGEVVITGSPTATDTRGAQDVSSLDDAQLRAHATGSIGRTLERMPGVSNMSGGPAAGNPVLRGLSQSRVRIVNDGIPQESFEASPRWFAPGDVATADRIEVIRGPASILYGSSAIGGAINIIPRALPVAGAGNYRIDGLVEARYGSNNDERYGHAEIAGTTGSLGVVAGGSRRVAGNFHTPSATPYSVSKVQGAPAFVGEINYTNYDQATTYAQVGVARRWGSARILVDDWNSSNNFPNANGKPTGVTAHNTNVRFQGTLVSRAVIVKPSVSVQNVGIRRAATVAKTFEVAADSNLWDQHLRNRVVTSRIELEHSPIRGLRGTIGADYSHQDASTRRSQIQPSGTVANAALFALEQYRVGSLTLTAGVRGDTRTQRAKSSALVDSAPANERAGLLDRDFSVATGSIGGAYAFGESFTVSANVGRGFRAPSFLDLYTNENRPALGGWVEGNPRAKPEQSTTSEVGVHYAATRAELGIVGYRNQLSNFTYLAKSDRTRQVGSSLLPVFVTSQARGRITGLEVNGRVSILQAVALSADYARISSKNIATGERLPLMPANQFRSALRFAPTSLGPIETPYVELGAKHAFAKTIAGPTEPFADGGSKGFGVASTDAYTTANAELGGRVTFGASALEVHVSIDNIFGTAYRDYLDTQKGFTLAAGRNVTVRVAAPFVLGQ